MQQPIDFSTMDEAAIIEHHLTASFPVTLSSLAKALGTTPREAAQKLPADMARFVTGNANERFDDLWARLAEWGKVTLFVIHDGHVFEIEGKLHTGKRMHGYYNILSRHATIGGHLRCDSIDSIAFLTLPFMKRESLSVQFFNPQGDVTFAVYVGRENHQLIESVREAFFADRDTFTKPTE